MKHIYLTFEETKAVIAPLGLKTRRDYLHYVKSNNIKNLSLTPEPAFYHKGWKGFADFLGISQEEYEYNKRKHSYCKKDKVTTSTKPVTFIDKPRCDVVSGLNPDDVISFLIKEDVEPEIIVKMVAELDIKSSTLMNDLCKYMQSKSNKSDIWRPTGYKTAEAQMTTNI